MDEPLERRVESQTNKGGKGKIVGEIKDYLVDTSCAWVYYGSVMAGVEFATGMESSQILKSRLAGAVVHATIMKPYGKLRKGIAERLKGNKESSPLKKAVVDVSSMLTFQAPMYATMLYLANVPFERAMVSYPTGLAVGIVQAFAFGFVLDKWREQFGRKPDLY